MPITTPTTTTRVEAFCHPAAEVGGFDFAVVYVAFVEAVTLLNRRNPA